MDFHDCIITVTWKVLRWLSKKAFRELMLLTYGWFWFMNAREYLFPTAAPPQKTTTCWDSVNHLQRKRKTWDSRGRHRCYRKLNVRETALHIQQNCFKHTPKVRNPEQSWTGFQLGRSAHTSKLHHVSVWLLNLVIYKILRSKQHWR